jgi:membrane dipeptidase
MHAQLVELRKRGWSRAELSGLTGGNVMRVLAKAETVASQMRSEGVLPAQDLYSERKDLPVHREL